MKDATLDSRRIKVHKPDLFIELATSIDVKPEKVSPPRKSVAMFGHLTKLTADDNIAMKKAVREAATTAKTERNRKMMEKRAAMLAEASELDFQSRIDAVVKENEEIVPRASAFIINQESRSLRKMAQSHSTWEENTFGPIQDAITDLINSESHSTLTKRRRKHFDNYLQECNSKVGVFRDIIIESDYDPLLCRSENRKRLPNSLIQTASNHKLHETDTPNNNPKHCNRNVLDITLWDKVESTPHGRYSHTKPLSESFCRPRPPTDVNLDHFSGPIPVSEHKSLLTREFCSKGKSIVKPVSHSQVEHKGKAMVKNTSESVNSQPVHRGKAIIKKTTSTRERIGI